jgi:hypothetical protein
MNVVAKAVDKIANPPRVSDPDWLRAVVSCKTVLFSGATSRKWGAPRPRSSHS